MAIKAEEILPLLGLTEDVENITLDDFKAKVGEKYVLREEVLKDEEIKKKFTGTVLGKLSTKAAQQFGLTSGEVKDKSMEEIFDLAKTKYESQVAELKEQAGKGNDKKVEELNKKLADLQSELGIKETGLKQWEEKYNTEIAGSEQKLKTFKLNDTLNKVKSSLSEKFTEEYKKNDLVKEGFETHISRLYEFDLDEKENPVVKSKADGKVVISKKTIGHPATIQEIFEQEMEAKGVLKKNNGKPAAMPAVYKDNGGGERKSKIHPKALAHMETLTGK